MEVGSGHEAGGVGGCGESPKRTRKEAPQMNEYRIIAEVNGKSEVPMTMAWTFAPSGAQIVSAAARAKTRYGAVPVRVQVREVSEWVDVVDRSAQQSFELEGEPA